MNTQSDYAEVADRFAAVAQEYCSAPQTDRATLLLQVYRVLPVLISQAIKLPNIESDDDAIEPEQVASRLRVRMANKEWGELYNLLKEN